MKFAVALAVLLAAFPLTALELGTPFADNAILQRDMPVPVWGWSKPGTKITVTFAGQEKVAKTARNGKWTVTLDPMPAAFEGRVMTVASTDGNRQLSISNVLVGEVWMASGQSNMQWVASKSDVGRVLQKQIKARVDVGIEKAPVIREAKVTNYFATQQPIERAAGAWSMDEGEFSAIAYAFAYELARDLEVPIGIVNCSFSQTAIQAWTPRQGFAGGTDEYTKAIYQRLLESDPTTTQHKAAWNAYYASIEETLSANKDRVKRGRAPRAIPMKTPGSTHGNRDATWLFNARMNPMVPYAIRGAIWNQGYANAGEGLVYYNNLHSMIRGWRNVWGRPDLPVYFHQFYSAGRKADSPNHPSIDPMAEMRLGTWMARNIPYTGMASQIDIAGGIHYTNKALPGKRLALHALRNQYGRRISAEGPSFKTYAVDGNKLIVSFEYAADGLVVGETGSNAKQLATPTVIDDDGTKIDLFYLADEKRVWHKAKARITGSQVVLTAAGVSTPRGVSYGTGGIGFQPNLYNKAMLPMSPFICYDYKIVTKDTWPGGELEIAGLEPDPSKLGLKAYWYKMPILSTQFRDNAVLQAGKPITFFGSVLHEYGIEAEGEVLLHFSFNGITKSIPVSRASKHIVTLDPADAGRDGREWRITVPAMEASAEPKTLKVWFTIDGETVHERVCTNIVIGDVWYVATPKMALKLPTIERGDGPVRVMQRKAKRSTSPQVSRYSVCVSRTPKNRFACEWTDAKDGLAAVLGHQLHAKTGKPVGIIYMENTTAKDGSNPPLKSWIPFADLQRAASLQADYEDLAVKFPGTAFYDANARRYIAAWKSYWAKYVTEMMKTKAVPDGVPWGSMPQLAGEVTSKASETYNVMTHSFTPAALKGIIFLSSPDMFAGDNAAAFGEQLSALANSWKARFGVKAADTLFIYTTPTDKLVPGLTVPQMIQGNSTAVTITDWSDIDGVLKMALESQ